MKNVTKGDVITLVSKMTGMSKKNSRKVLEAISQIFLSTAANRDKLTLRGILTIEPKERKATTKRNPRTGEIMNIPPKWVVKMRAGRKLKNAVKDQTVE
ncbi:MAG: HU family DNA-binding protein [bacterium]|nr:HU family DNA-binding protein [bacterium]